MSSEQLTAATPTAQEPIPLSVPALSGGNEGKYLKECLDTGWVSSAGPFVERFERAMAEYVGVTYAVAAVNGTAGLHLALRAVLVQPDDEVLVPALTFIAPVNAVRYCGAHPVFVDADRSTWQMDLNQLERFLVERCELRPVVSGPVASSDEACWNTTTGRRVRAILPVHLLGLACEMDRLRELARRFHLRVVEDAAEAIGVRYRGRPVGAWGDVGVFSFNGNKTITCGGGGMVVSDRKPYAEYARYLATQAKDDSKEYVHNEVGYNYRLTNLQAAVGLAQLERLSEFLEKKRMMAQRYREAFLGVPEITPMPEQEGAVYWLFTILVPNRAQRDALLACLAEARIEARPLWQPIHALPPYQGCQRAGPIEVATELYDRAVSLPSSVGLRDADQQRCIRVVTGGVTR